MASTATPFGVAETFAGEFTGSLAVSPEHGVEPGRSAWEDFAEELEHDFVITDFDEAFLQHRTIERKRIQTQEQIRTLLESSVLAQLLPPANGEDGQQFGDYDFSDPSAVLALLGALEAGLTDKKHLAEPMIQAPSELEDPSLVGHDGRNPCLFFGRGARLPKLRVDLQKDGKDFDMTIRVSGQQPNVTAREGASATRDAGEALYETLQDELYRSRENSSGKATVVAITYTCGEIILDNSKRNDMASGSKLEEIIGREHPSLLQDELFKRVLRHFNTDPESFRESFTQRADAAVTQIVLAHPARAAFLQSHRLSETGDPENSHG